MIRKRRRGWVRSGVALTAAAACAWWAVPAWSADLLPAPAPATPVAVRVERPLFAPELSVDAGPLSLVRLRHDLPRGPVRRQAFAEAMADARRRAAARLAEITARLPSGQWLLADLRAAAVRAPGAAPSEDPLLADWLARGYRPSASFAADDPVIASVDLSVSEPVPLPIPESRGQKASAAYQAEFAARTALRRRQLRAVIGAIAAGRVRVVCDAEMQSVPRGPTADRLTATVADRIAGELTAAGMPAERTLRPLGRTDAQLLAGADLLLVIRVREQKGGVPGRDKSRGSVELSLLRMAGGRVERVFERFVLGEDPANLFSSGENSPTGAAAVDEFLTWSTDHILADGRLVQAFSALVPLQWSAE